MRPNIIFPSPTGETTTQEVSGSSNIVIIGANGAGKTRIGAWIEDRQPGDVTVHRISAQRALNIPDSATIQTLDMAEKALFFGYLGPNAALHHKGGHRWGGNASTHLLNDFEFLLSTLFAKTTRRDREHAKATQAQQAYIPVENSAIDIIINVWQDIMPHNSIDFDDGKVLVSKDAQNYHGKEMSDGERVSIYLLGQCLSAPENSIIIIDEPEIHLHKSLMSRLWNKIEELCPNKVLIWITHDLDFATSRKEAKKIWLKKFLGQNTWEWEEVPEISELPENLVLEIIGNRKKVIFCEGDKGSTDLILYQSVYPDHYVVPRGGCEKVIEATKAIRGNASLHHLEAVGIIDSDYRTTEEITSLNGHNIFTISVAEVENLLCIEPIVRIVAEHLAKDIDPTVTEVKAFIFQELNNELELQITNHAESEIQFRLNTYVKASATSQGLQDAMDNLVASIDTMAIYNRSKALFNEVITENNYEKVLQLYNRKKLAERISPILGLGKKEYVNIVFRLLKTEKKTAIITALRAFMPAI
jgi:ABC-type cobalamin/Fe3+-siderophores transport system ATPase subunit